MLSLTARQIYLFLLSSSPPARSSRGGGNFSAAFWRKTFGAGFAPDLASARCNFSAPLPA